MKLGGWPDPMKKEPGTGCPEYWRQPLNSTLVRFGCFGGVNHGERVEFFARPYPMFISYALFVKPIHKCCDHGGGQ